MVVEFFDYQCIWCSRFAPELEKVIRSNQDVRYFFMEWPVFGADGRFHYWQPKPV
jgi:protein-disulfide isomerase